MLISVLSFTSLSASRSAGGRLFVGFVMCTSASWYLTLSRKLSKATDCCTGGFQFDFTWKGCGSLYCPWNMYWRRIRLANWLKSCKSWRLIRLSFVTGVGINLSPFDTRLIWSFVSSLLERFLICFLFASRVSFCAFYALEIFAFFSFSVCYIRLIIDPLTLVNIVEFS